MRLVVLKFADIYILWQWLVKADSTSTFGKSSKILRSCHRSHPGVYSLIKHGLGLINQISAYIEQLCCKGPQYRKSFGNQFNLITFPTSYLTLCAYLFTEQISVKLCGIELQCIYDKK